MIRAQNKPLAANPGALYPGEGSATCRRLGVDPPRPLAIHDLINLNRYVIQKAGKNMDTEYTFSASHRGIPITNDDQGYTEDDFTVEGMLGKVVEYLEETLKWQKNRYEVYEVDLALIKSYTPTETTELEKAREFNQYTKARRSSLRLVATFEPK